MKQHPELVFAGRATSAWSRDIGGAISNTLNGYFRFPRWISCSTVIFWYIANLAVGAFAVALIGIWLAGIVAILAAQIVVFIVALPFAAVYAGQEQKRQRKLERHNYVVYLVEKYIEQTGDEQVDHDAFNDWVIEQEDK